MLHFAANMLLCLHRNLAACIARGIKGTMEPDLAQYALFPSQIRQLFYFDLLKLMQAKGNALPARITQKDSSFEVREAHVRKEFKIMSERDKLWGVV